ncbi:MAG: DinB family protein [Bryobacteraceae bacterium]
MRLIIGTLLAVAVSSVAPAEPLTQGERDRAMSHLHATRKALLDSVAGLSEAQWKFKAGEDRWSVAECAEHLTVSEEFLFKLVTEKVMQAPPAKADPEMDAKILKMLTDRSQKAQAPEFLKPSNRWATPVQMMDDFKKRRDETIAYVQTTQDDLRGHAVPHPAFKMLDGYQWILLISGHAERHTAQINEVKADPKFPKK